MYTHYMIYLELAPYITSDHFFAPCTTEDTYLATLVPTSSVTNLDNEILISQKQTHICFS